MHVINHRRCEVNDCKNKEYVIEIPYYQGAVKRICAKCLCKALSVAMQRREIESSESGPAQGG